MLTLAVPLAPPPPPAQDEARFYTACTLIGLEVSGEQDWGTWCGLGSTS